MRCVCGVTFSTVWPNVSPLHVFSYRSGQCVVRRLGPPLLSMQVESFGWNRTSGRNEHFPELGTGNGEYAEWRAHLLLLTAMNEIELVAYGPALIAHH